MAHILVAGRDIYQVQFIKRILIGRKICAFDDISLMCNGLQIREALLTNSYRLVILNEELGGMGGIECIEALRSQHIEHYILYMTYNPRVEIIREVFLLGVQGVYELPILLDGFTAMVVSLLNRKRMDCGSDIYKLYTKYRYYDS